jgi:chromosome partitioning protein
MNIAQLDLAKDFPFARTPKIPPRLAENISSNKIRMMVSNQKGGVGKTVIAYHATAACVQAKIKTVAVDFDPQGGGNFTTTLLNTVGLQAKDVDVESFITTADLFAKELPNKPLLQLGEYLYLIPASNRLNDANDIPMEDLANPKRNLELLPIDAPVTILDTPPTTGKQLVGALMAATHAVLPFEPAKFSIEGAEELMQKIKFLRRRYNPDMKVAGFVPSRFKSRSKYQNMVLNAMKGQGFPLLWPPIPEMVSIQESVDGNYFTGTPPKPVWNVNSRAGNEVGEAIKNILKGCIDHV